MVKAMDGINCSEALHFVNGNKDGATKTALAAFLLSGCSGAERDPERAVELLKERVKEEDGEAMWMLGLCCEYGMGTEVDFDEAQRLYESSSSKGCCMGDLFVGFCHGEKGRGGFGVVGLGL